MWKCPRCGRSFAQNNQEHACLAITTVDEYISAQPEEVQPLLQTVREAIHQAAPDASEKIAWRMPTFWQGQNLIHFAAFKKHIGIYPGGEATTVFADRLTGYKTSKGAIQMPLSEPLDLELVADITKWRLEQVLASKKNSR